MTSPGRAPRFLPLILGTLTAFAPISIDMYLPGLPLIGDEFGVATASVQLTLVVFLIGLALGQLVYGPLADRYGRRGPLIAGCALYTIASVGIAIAPTLNVVIGLRLFQALGGCAGIVIARSIVRDWYDERDSARVYALLLLVTGLAPILAPIVGSVLLDSMGWRVIFWLLAGFGLFCLALALFALPESLPPERRTRTNLAASLGVYGALLRDRPFMGYALAGGLSFGGLFAYISGSSAVLIDGYGVSSTLYSLLFGVNAAGMVAAAQFNSWLRDRFSSATVMAAATAAGAAMALLMALMALMNALLPFVLLPLFVAVATTGLVSPNTAAAAMAPQGGRAGSASAMLGAIQFGVGASIGSLASVFSDGSAVPMGLIMACAAAATFAVLQWVVLQQAAPIEGTMTQ
jgi:DHA1 family bicyclomycin/chloramphenicol resistance-like MFS transporter